MRVYMLVLPPSSLHYQLIYKHEAYQNNESKENNLANPHQKPKQYEVIGAWVIASGADAKTKINEN